MSLCGQLEWNRFMLIFVEYEEGIIFNGHSVIMLNIYEGERVTTHVSEEGKPLVYSVFPLNSPFQSWI